MTENVQPLAAFGAFGSAGLGCPNPPKRPPAAGAAGAVPVAPDAGVRVDPPNRPPVGAGVVVVFPKSPPPTGAAAGVLVAAPALALFVIPNPPNRPPPGVPVVGAGVGLPKRPAVGCAARCEDSGCHGTIGDALGLVFAFPKRPPVGAVVEFWALLPVDDAALPKRLKALIAVVRCKAHATRPTK